MIDHLSYSSISHYLQCQRSWKHKYIDQIETDKSDALLFGSAWHKMISKSLLEKGYRLFGQLWRESSEELDGYLNSNIFDLGLSMISSKHISDTLQNLKPHERQVLIDTDNNGLPFHDYIPMVDYKIEFSIPNVPVPIIGYIDMIADDRVPVDFKTAKHKWTQEQADSSLQPTFYLAGLHAQDFIKASDFPAKFRYIIFLKTKKPDVQIIETTRTDEDVINLFGLVEGCWQQMQSENHLPTGIGSWKCSSNYCDFWNICQGGRIK